MYLQTVVYQAAEKFPENIAVIFDDGLVDAGFRFQVDDGHDNDDENNIKFLSAVPSAITYQQLWKHAEEISSFFSFLPLSHTTVAVLLKPSIHLPAILLGLLSKSCCFFPVSINNGHHYITECLRKTGSSWVLIDKRFHKKFQPVVEELEGEYIDSSKLNRFNVVLVKLTTDIKQNNEGQLFSDESIAYCITTSGTTGSPKVIRVPHSCLMPNILDFQNIYKVTSQDKILLTSPLTFDPSLVDIFVALSSGACLVIVPDCVKMTPDLFIHTVHHRQKVTIIQATPSLIRQCPSQQLKQTLLGLHSSLRILALGGENFPNASELKSWIDEGNQTLFYNLYGITEVSCWASCEFVDLRHVISSHDPVSIGRPLSQTLLRLECYNEPDKAEGQGFIWIGSSERICFVESEVKPAIHKSSTLVEMSDGASPLSDNEAVGGQLLNKPIVWQNTGDIGRRLDDGRIVFVGRLDDQVKRHGKRMNLSGLETICNKLPWISKSCALVNNDNQLVVFYSKLESGVNKFEEYNLRIHIQKSLPSHFMPDIFAKLNKFPLTSHGKLDKKKLLEMKSNVELDIISLLCSSPLDWLKQLWKKYLPKDVTDIRKEDSFLFLGGNSLAAVSLVNEMEKHFGEETASRFLDPLLNKTFVDCIDWLLVYLQEEGGGKNALASTRNQTENNVNSVDFKEEEINFADSKDETVTILDSASVNVNVDHVNIINSKDDNVDSYGENVNIIERNIYLTDSKDENVTGVDPRSNINSRKQCLKCSENHDCVNTKCLISDSSTSDRLSPAEIWSRNYESGNSLHPHDLDIKKDLNSMATDSLDFCIICRGNRLLRGQQQKTEGTRKFKLMHQRNETKNRKDDTDSLHKELPSNLMQENDCVNDTVITNDSIVESFRDSDLDSSLLDYKPLLKRDFHLSDQCGAGLTDKSMLHLQWKVDTKKCVDASPVVVVFGKGQSVAFIGSHSGLFLAVQVDTGDILWTTQLGDRIESSACVSKNLDYIIVGCYDGNVYILDLFSGDIAWKFETGSCIKCSPCLDTNTNHVICGSHDGWLYCLDVEDRKCVWKHHFGGGSVYSSPVVNPEFFRVIAASLNGRVISLNTQDGCVHWTCDLGKPLFASPCLHGTSVLIGCVDKHLYCLDWKGDKEWVFQTNGPIFSSPISNGNLILFGCHDFKIYCLSSQGHLLWTFSTVSPIFSTPFIFHHQNIIQSNIATDNINEPQCKRSKSQNDSIKIEEQFYDLLTKTSNTLIKDKNESGKSQHSNMIGGETKCSVVFANTLGTLYIINCADGMAVTSVDLPGEIFSSPVVVNCNKIIVGCRDNFLYCYDFL